ncbi:hypothetical protein [Demequina sp. NBRC 110054]|uniref:hypothetical protein n=1 Tax=Demequina sp. NBRC 110054 TaxID=1570343 RepID=UPI000A00EB16|nr:hypothetical protein [Demequina sp. NBRC 110054]
MRAWVLGVLIAVAGIAAVAGVYLVLSGDDPAVSPSPSATASVSATPSPSASVTDAATASPAAASPSPSATPSTEEPEDPTRTGVGVSLTRYGVSDGVLTAAAIVSDVVEEGGTCSLVLSGSTEELSVDGPGTPSATTTDCAEGLSLDVSDLSGSWILWITYDSPDSYGTSDSAEIDLS